FDFHPHPLDWLHFDHSFSYVRGKQRHRPEDERNLPSIPAPRYSTNLKAQFKQAGPVLSNAYFKIGMEYNFKQDKFLSAFNTETFTPGYTLWNLGMGTTIKAFHKKDFINLYL